MDKIKLDIEIYQNIENQAYLIVKCPNCDLEKEGRKLDIFDTIWSISNHNATIHGKETEFDAFLERILPDEKDRLTVYEWFGHCLWSEKDNIKQIWILIGNGHGKSTLLKVLEIFLGEENISKMSLDELTNNHFALSQLIDKKVNIISDIELNPIKFEYIITLKKLVSGDTLFIDRKYKKAITSTISAKIILTMNHPFQINSDDTNVSLLRRFNILHFNEQLSSKEMIKPKSLITRITTKKELSAILDKALEGVKRLIKTKKFSNHKSESELLKGWK